MWVSGRCGLRVRAACWRPTAAKCRTDRKLASRPARAVGRLLDRGSVGVDLVGQGAGTLVDLPETATRARQYLAGLGLAGRGEVVGQSFFDPLPAGAGAYLLDRVIHDWDDAAAGAVLRRCREAAHPTGRVLVVESHGAADADPAAFAEMNLRMLVLTGGRERTIDEYTALAANAGLGVTAVHDITAHHMIIDCLTHRLRSPQRNPLQGRARQ